MLKLIENEPKQKPDYNSIYRRLFCRKVIEYHHSPDDRQLLKQTVYYGIMHINASDRENAEETFLVGCYVKDRMAELTPRELITIFPISKTYDGDKTETKDYFYTIKALKNMGLDNRIGDNVDDILWDYMNHELTFFNVIMMSALSKLRQKRGEPSLIEEFALENGIDAYVMEKDKATGKQYVKSSMTGEKQEVKRAKPRYLKLIL